MAATKSKRSVRKKQSAHNHQSKPERSRRRRRSKNTKAHRRVFHFPQTRGKLIEDVEFSTFSDYHNISINFQDKTCLNFSIETGFTLESDYSDWKTGNQRILRAWQPIKVLNS